MRSKSWSLVLAVAMLLSPLWAATSRALVPTLDFDPPSVTIVNPEDRATVRGQVRIEAEATDGLLGTGISKVEYQLDTTLGNWTPLSMDLTTMTYKGNWQTESIADGSHNLYVRAVDNAGNQQTVSVVVTVANPPAAPTGLTVTAPAPPSNGAYLDLYWNPNLEGDRAGYNVYRSTAPAGPYVKVASPQTNAYRDTGLKNGSTYYYVVTAVDTAGNESLPSGEASATPQDTQAPTISGVTATIIDPNTADINWTTDEPTFGRVEYGMTQSTGSTAVDSTDPKTSHRITLTDLLPGTTYYYRVIATDPSGNEAISEIYSLTTLADNSPAVAIISPLAGSILQGAATLQVSATDDWGLGAVQYSLDGINWQSLGYNSFTGYYEATVDTRNMGEGPRKIGARATDAADQTTQAVIDVTVDNLAPTLTVVTPGEDAHLQAGMTHIFQAIASDAGTGLTAVESQVFLVPPGQEIETPPNPDPALWQPMVFNSQSGYWEVAYLAPLIVTEREGWAYTRATDGSGKSTQVISPLTLLPNGREFEFTAANGGSISGMVTIEVIDGVNRIGVDMVGRDLQPGKTYTLNITSGGRTVTVTLTADDRGRGEVQYEADTEMSDEFGADLSMSGPAF